MSFVFRILLILCFCPHVTVEGCIRVFNNRNSAYILFARAMDLFVDDKPELMICPRGIERQGQVPELAKRWRSKYGSVVVGSFENKIISDGINEAGLGAHVLYVSDAAYERRHPSKRGISNFLWVQYVLDNFKTVKQVLEHLEEIQVVSTRLAQKEWPLHLAVEDIYGNSAVVEFIGGSAVVHHGQQCRVVTDCSSHALLLEGAKRVQHFSEIHPGGRFVRAMTYLQTLPTAYDHKEGVAAMFSLIHVVQVPFGADDHSGTGATDVWETRWATVGDLTHRIYYFSNAMQPNVIKVDLNQFDLSPGRAVQVINPSVP